MVSGVRSTKQSTTKTSKVQKEEIGQIGSEALLEHTKTHSEGKNTPEIGVGG